MQIVHLQNTERRKMRKDRLLKYYFKLYNSYISQVIRDKSRDINVNLGIFVFQLAYLMLNTVVGLWKSRMSNQLIELRHLVRGTSQDDSRLNNVFRLLGKPLRNFGPMERLLETGPICVFLFVHVHDKIQQMTFISSI